MSKHAIEIRKWFEPFVYETTEGIVKIYKKTKHKCPEHTIDVLQWGDVTWTSMEGMFRFCDKITTFTATDRPNLYWCNDVNDMFYGAKNFNQNIGNWDVSRVENMKGMFWEARSFNQDIGDWNVGNVTDMDRMFAFATNFNQDIEDWDVSKVKNMDGMFYNAKSFNKNLSEWDVSNVTNMNYMFYNAYNFNQEIDNWDVSNVTNMMNVFYDCPIQENYKPRFKY